MCLLVSKEPAVIYAVYLHVLLAFYAEETFYSVSSLSFFTPYIYTQAHTTNREGRTKMLKRTTCRNILKKEDISGCQYEIVIECKLLLSVHFPLLRGLC